jgi:hypothetical protein
VMHVAESAKSRLFSNAEAEGRKRWALELIQKLGGGFRMVGYGLFHGGTLVRDIDLVAVPWTDGKRLMPPDEIIVELVHRFGLTIGNRGETLNGHKWYALWHPDHPDHQIDLKVILPAAKLESN